MENDNEMQIFWLKKIKDRVEKVKVPKEAPSEKHLFEKSRENICCRSKELGA